MAEAQALSILTNPYATADQRNALIQFQRKQALAAALQQQGMSPLETNGRSIGGVGYAISPTEGLAKLAQALTGAYGQKHALDSLSGALSAQPQAQSGPTTGDLTPAAPAPQDLPAGANGVSPSNAQALGNALQPQSQQMQLPPQLQSIGLRNPEVLDKAIADNYFADHRAGAMYRGPDGQLHAAPTDQMQNVGAGVPGSTAFQSAAGTAAAAQLPVGQLSSVMGGGGSNPAVSGGNIPMPPPPSALPQGNGPFPVPTSPQQIQGLLPNAGQQASPQMQSPPDGIKISGNPPPPIDPMLTSGQNEALLKAWQAGQTSQSEAIGKAAGEAQKGEATIDSRFDNSQAILAEMRKLSSRTSGGPSAAIMEPIHRQFNDQTSADNASLENLASNQLTTALAPIVQGVGGRIDVPLMKAISAAESMKLDESEKGKKAIIDNLSKMLEVQRQNAHNLTGALNGNPVAPQPSPISSIQGFKYLGVKNGNP